MKFIMRKTKEPFDTAVHRAPFWRPTGRGQVRFDRTATKTVPIYRAVPVVRGRDYRLTSNG